MLSSRAIVFCVALMWALSAGATAAIADNPPPSAAMTIQSIDFESPTDPVSASVWALPSFSPTPTAWWGRVAGSGQSGFGLWCAGTGGAWPTFPLDTGGMAEWQLPDTSAFYESEAVFSYAYPGPYYYGDFSLRWFGPGLDPHSAPPSSDRQPDSVASWTTVRLTRVSGSGNLGSNTVGSGPGTLEFKFVDFERVGAAERGATIDNLLVTGWRYGPSPSVVASRVSDTDVLVTWDRPHVSASSSTEVTDSPEYRVWRHDITAGTWTELTSDGLRVSDAARSITDSGAVSTHLLQYSAQAWATGAESARYGHAATSNEVSPPKSAFGGLSCVPASVAFGGWSTIAATLTLQSDPGTTLAGRTVTLQASANGMNSWTDVGVATEDSAGHYVATVSTTAKRYYRLHFATDSTYYGSDSAAAIVLSKAYLSAPSSKSKAKRKRTLSVSGFLKTRHTRGAKSVVIKAYRYQSRKWVLRQTFSAVNSDYSSYTKYSASIKLKYAGKWRLYAYHADADHTATTSGYRSVTVK